MSLESYSRNRWIRKHRTTPREIADLLAVADRDIEQSQIPGLGSEWRFDIAYNSALQSATAALAAAGYRAERANKHLRVIEMAKRLRHLVGNWLRSKHPGQVDPQESTGTPRS